MLPIIVACAVLAQTAPSPSEAPVPVAEVRQAVEKSLPFLDKNGLEWETKSCVSCHHGPWMMWSGYEARRRGFTVNEKSLDQVRAGMIKAYDTHPTFKPTARDVLTELSINVIYLTLSLGAAGEPDAETARFLDKSAAYILEQQQENGSWKVFIKKIPDGLMPPLIDSDDVTTLWALLALDSREPAGISKESLERSKARGLKYLSDNRPADTLQSLVLRILLNQRLGQKDEVQRLAEQLVNLQQENGGWIQAKKFPADALGTGQALVALAAAGFTSENPAVNKARAYLIKTQKGDGSWDVTSRAYEGPKFSSYMGTAWAVLGLMRSLPEIDPKVAVPR